MTTEPLYGGVMTQEAFCKIEGQLLKDIQEHLDEIDGLFLHLHGASEVDTIGSGEHHILFSIRKLLGPYIPIAVVCDPHGNLSKEYVEATSIIRSYRETPHTDIAETHEKVATLLCELLKKRRMLKPIYRKLPLLLGGEQSVSSDEPVKSINALLDQYEQDYRILSCSWHVGYLRHDTHLAGCGLVVVPNDEDCRDYANSVADSLYDYVWSRRRDFHYTGLTMEPDDAIHWAETRTSAPAFISDSGDNVTSGAAGANTMVLRQILARDGWKKKTLFASICDKELYKFLSGQPEGCVADVLVGAGCDTFSASVAAKVVVRGKYRQIATNILGEFGALGQAVLVSVADKPIDILVANTNQPYVERDQILACGIDWNDYEVVVIKCGYAFPKMKSDGQCVMSLTEGATYQNTKKLPLKRIMRPIYPIDDI